jgi:APA family basic amino acid/polyamine antiporter
MAGPRVTMAMADDGRFFAVFARRGRRGAPWVAVLAQGGVACALVATAAFDALLTYIGFTLSVFTALTVVAAWRLRRRAPAQARPYRAFGWPLSPSLFLLLSAWMAGAVVYARPAAAAAGALTLAAGAGLYRLWQPDAGGSG